MGEDQTQSRELLSPSEERDLETLLTSTDLTITDIDELSSKLTQQLSLLELVCMLAALILTHDFIGKY